MIRWTYVTPRLIVLAILCLFFWLASEPLLRWAFVSLAKSATGAKVEIGRLQASLLRGEFGLHDLQLVDPHRSQELLIQANAAKLELETAPLLKRRFVVREGCVRGLQVNADWVKSLAIEAGRDEREKWLWSSNAVNDLARKWFDQAAEQLGRGVEQELESIRLAKELKQRWTDEFQKLESRAESMKSRLERLRDMTAKSGGDPLQTIDSIQQAAADLERLSKEMAALRSDMEGLVHDARCDKAAVAEAARRDIERIQALTSLGDLDGEALSRYLLGSELHDCVAAVIQWIRWTRQYLPSDDQPQPSRGRGLDIEFPGARHPSFLIRSLVLEGESRWKDKVVPFRCLAADLTTQAKLHDEAARLVLRTGAPVALVVEAVLDHRRDTPHDRILIDLPAIAQPQRVLGLPDRLSLSVSPGNLHLQATLELRGELLKGRLTLEQDPVELTPRLGREYQSDRLAEFLESVTREVRRLEAQVDLAGTLQQPSFQFHSNLGVQLSAGLSNAFQQELAKRRDELAGRLQTTVDGELATFEQVLEAKQGQLLAALQLSNSVVAELTVRVARNLRLPTNMLRDRSPLPIPARR